METMAPHVHVDRRGQARALRLALIVNGVFLIAEIVGGFAFHSLALLADAAHMFSDVAALTIALIAQRLIERPPSSRHTYGLQRAEVLAAQVNGLILIAAFVWIVVESIGRLSEPSDVRGGGLLLVATLGLVVNLGSAAVLWRSRGSSLNMRGAWLHMMVDAAGSVGAMTAAGAVLLWDADRADPIISLVVAAMVLWSAVHLIRETTHVLLEGAPRGIDTDAVQEAIAKDPAVEEVHHLHVWNIASDTPALSAHVVVADEQRLHEAQLHADRIKTMLHERFGIDHSTLELECHRCGPETHSVVVRTEV
jgi:cobalt-zinc-cadmium efflux system protein